MRNVSTGIRVLICVAHFKTLSASVLLRKHGLSAVTSLDSRRGKQVKNNRGRRRGAGAGKSSLTNPNRDAP
jgi:hypothetical protein